MSTLEPGQPGKYELTAVQWDEITSKPGEELVFIRHRRGDIVELGTEHAARLWKAGALAIPGEREKAAAALAFQQLQVALGALTPEQREEMAAALQSEAPAAAPSTRPSRRSTRSTPSAPVATVPPTGPSEAPDSADLAAQPPTGGAVQTVADTASVDAEYADEDDTEQETSAEVGGTVASVLDAVGSDSVKAREALSAEQSRPQPRATLVTALTRIVESSGQ